MNSPMKKRRTLKEEALATRESYTRKPFSTGSRKVRSHTSLSTLLFRNSLKTFITCLTNRENFDAFEEKLRKMSVHSLLRFSKNFKKRKKQRFHRNITLHNEYVRRLDAIIEERTGIKKKKY